MSVRPLGWRIAAAFLARCRPLHPKSRECHVIYSHLSVIVTQDYARVRRRLASMGPPRKRDPTVTNADLMVRACSDIVRELVIALEAGHNVNLNALKGRVSREHRLPNQPKLVDIIAAIPEEYKALLLPKLKAKPVRTASGIAVVAVMCKPHRCPHISFTGNICVYERVFCARSPSSNALSRYCPGGPDSDFEYSTQSYTGYEPTSMRAIRGRYHPLAQAKSRMDQLRSLGHSVDKVEYIVMGGTFMSLPEDYRDFFIRNLHDALTGHTSTNVDEAVRLVSFAVVEHLRSFCFRLVLPFLLFLLLTFLLDSPSRARQSALASRLKRAPTTACALT